MIQLSDILLYPVKSLGGFSVSEARLERRGLQYDRRWMVVDETGMFISQREIPAMIFLGARIVAGRLEIYSKQNPMDFLAVPVRPDWAGMPKIRVSVWSATCTARVYGPDVNGWLSSYLGRPVRLVYMPDVAKRATDGRYAPKGQYVSFADAFPYIVIGQASLDDLNRRLSVPVPMNRFRPNFVCTGTNAFEEDSWEEFMLGSASFKGVKCCARCIMTTIDQDNATQAAEPLKTLSSYRRSGNKVLFGRYVIWTDASDQPAIVQVGDLIRFDRPGL